MLFHKLADDTVKGFLAVDCVAVDPTWRREVVKELEEGGGEDWLAVWGAGLFVVMRVLAGYEGWEAADVVEHLLHEVVHILGLWIEGLCGVRVAWCEVATAGGGGHGECVAWAVDVAGVNSWSTFWLLLDGSWRTWRRCCSMQTLISLSLCVFVSMLMPMRLLLSLLLSLLLQQSTNHIPNHAQQTPTRPRSLTLHLPSPVQINSPIESSMISRPLLPLEMINIILIRVRRIPRVMAM